MRPPKPNSVEPPRYGTRMPGGVGGVAPRGVPLSRSRAESGHWRIASGRSGVCAIAADDCLALRQLDMNPIVRKVLLLNIGPDQGEGAKRGGGPAG